MDWKTYRRVLGKYRKLQGNSIESNKRWVFMLKCINGLLPTLEKRYLQRPDLYKDAQCPRCNIANENSDHLTECPADAEQWHELDNCITEKITKISRDLSLSNVQIKRIQETFVPLNISEKGLQRKELARGMLRVDLGPRLQEIGISNKKTKKLLTTFLDTWLKEFQEKIWNKRCEKIVVWERSKGITQKKKRGKKEKLRTKEKRKTTKEGKSDKKEPSAKEKKIQEWTRAKARLEESLEKWIKFGVHECWNKTNEQL